MKSIFHFKALSTTSRIILFLLFCICTICSVFFIEQHQTVGPQLLLNADFSEGLSHWESNVPSSGEITALNNELHIKSSDAGKSAVVFQKLPNDLNGKKLHLRAKLATKNVTGGKKEWHKARLLLVQYNNGKAQWKLSHSVAALEGTNNWQNYEEVFTTSPANSEIRVIVQMGRCSGDLFIKNLSVYEVEETSLYTLAKWLIKGAWIVFIFVLFVPGLKGEGSAFLKICIVLTVVGIVVGTTLPGQVKNELKGDITEEVNSYTAPVEKAAEKFIGTGTAHYNLWKPDSTKIAHFCLFALLAFLILRKDPYQQKRVLLIELLMLAIATELMQFYVEGRSPLFTDVLIDMGGGSLVLAIGNLKLMKR